MIKNMKSTMLAIAILGWLSLPGCSDENNIGAPIEVVLEYVLPQGGASQWAEGKIQDMYDKYGSYFIYKTTQADFEWSLGMAQVTTSPDSIDLGNPIYVEGLLKFLDNIWLDHISDDFKKELGIPYRVLLVDMIWTAGHYSFRESKTVGKAITFSGVNADFANLTTAQKIAKKNAFNSSIWTDYYLNNGIVVFPEEFFTMSDYTTPVSTVDLNIYNEASAGMQAWRNRGFLPYMYYTNGSAGEWPYMFTNSPGPMQRDKESYMLHLLQRTDTEMQPFLDNYPLVKQKFEFLINYFNDVYGIDVRGIANMDFSE